MVVRYLKHWGKLITCNGILYRVWRDPALRLMQEPGLPSGGTGGPSAPTHSCGEWCRRVASPPSRPLLPNHTSGELAGPVWTGRPLLPSLWSLGGRGWGSPPPRHEERGGPVQAAEGPGPDGSATRQRRLPTRCGCTTGQTSSHSRVDSWGWWRTVGGRGSVPPILGPATGVAVDGPDGGGWWGMRPQNGTPAPLYSGNWWGP